MSSTKEHYNTFAGAYSNGAAGITNAIAIGYQAEATQSNSLGLGSINGVNGAGASVIVGIGTTAPKAIFHVEGGDAYVGSARAGDHLEIAERLDLRKIDDRRFGRSGGHSPSPVLDPHRN